MWSQSGNPGCVEYQLPWISTDLLQLIHRYSAVRPSPVPRRSPLQNI